jgi:hypothetical protein
MGVRYVGIEGCKEDVEARTTDEFSTIPTGKPSTEVRDPVIGAALIVEISFCKLTDVAALMPRIVSGLAEDAADVSDSASTWCMLETLNENSCGSDIEVAMLKP